MSWEKKFEMPPFDVLSARAKNAKVQVIGRKRRPIAEVTRLVAIKRAFQGAIFEPWRRDLFAIPYATRPPRI